MKEVRKTAKAFSLQPAYNTVLVCLFVFHLFYLFCYIFSCSFITSNIYYEVHSASVRLCRRF